MTFKFKNLMTLFLLFFGFICFSSNAYGFKHESLGEIDISYETEPYGKDGTLVKFGPISGYLQKDYRAQGSTGSLVSLVPDICKKNGATAVIFDNVEYVYNKSSATLTVTGREGSLYATAQNFVIEGLNLTNSDELDKEWARGVEAAHAEADKQGYGRRRADDPERVKIIRKELAAQKASSSRTVLQVEPLTKVIISGNIIRIGKDFCRACGGPYILSQGMTEYFPIEIVDMSKSHVREICIGAFFDCNKLTNFIPPETAPIQRISYQAFRRSPVEKSLPITPMQWYEDPRTPLNYSSLNACCAIM